MARLLPVLSLFAAACEIGDVHSPDSFVAGASIVASVLFSCFVAWLILR